MSVDPTTNRRTEALASYGEAMLAVQELEEQMVGLVGLRRELASQIDQAADDNKHEAVWEDLFTWPAGRLRNELEVGEQLAREVEQAISARNLLAHHYLRDRVARLGRESEDMVATLIAATARFRQVANRIEVERFAAMHNAGVTDDHVSIPSEARRMRYHDPTLDDEPPPEPFEDDDGSNP